MVSGMLSFRHMTRNDLSCINKLEHTASSYPWSISHFTTSLKSNHTCKVALINSTIIGHGVIMTIGDEAHLLILSVDGKHQRNGFGNAILENLIVEAKTRNCATLFLEVRESNLAAIHLYLKAGFNSVNRRNDYYPTLTNKREDAIVMAMDIITRD